LKACAHCGHVQHVKKETERCKICNEIAWEAAYV
jgi:hypothetical protein